MPRMPGRFRTGGCGCGIPGPDCSGHERDTRRRKRQEAREAEREISRYPSGYSPVTLLATRPDGPDPTGPLVSWEYLDPADPG